MFLGCHVEGCRAARCRNAASGRGKRGFLANVRRQVTGLGEVLIAVRGVGADRILVV